MSAASQVPLMVVATLRPGLDVISGERGEMR